MKTGYKVSDAMTLRPVTASPNLTLDKCAKLMAKEDVGSLLIVDKNKVVGIITEQDMTRNVVAKDLKPSTKKASDIMEKDVVKISPDKDIFDAIKMMRDYNIRHLPVVNKGVLLGMVTLKDVLKIQPDLFDILVEKFELKEEERKPVFLLEEHEGICQNCGGFSEELRYYESQLLCKKCFKEISKKA